MSAKSALIAEGGVGAGGGSSLDDANWDTLEERAAFVKIALTGSSDCVAACARSAAESAQFSSSTIVHFPQRGILSREHGQRGASQVSSDPLLELAQTVVGAGCVHPFGLCSESVLVGLRSGAH